MSNADFLQARVECLESLLRELTKDLNIATIEVLRDTLIDHHNYKTTDLAIKRSIELTNKMYKIKELLK